MIRTKARIQVMFEIDDPPTLAAAVNEIQGIVMRMPASPLARSEVISAILVTAPTEVSNR